MKFTATAEFARNRNLDLLIRSQIIPPLGRAVTQSCELILNEARRIVPVDTGELRDSGRKDVMEESRSVTGIVSFTAKHAAYVEYGTGQRGAASRGKGPYPYSAHWVGMPAQPYLRPAFDGVKKKILSIFRELLKDI